MSTIHDIHTDALETAEILHRELNKLYPPTGLFPLLTVHTTIHLTLPAYQHPKPSAFVSVHYAAGQRDYFDAEKHIALERQLNDILVTNRVSLYTIDPNEIKHPYPDGQLAILTFDIHLGQLP